MADAPLKTVTPEVLKNELQLKDPASIQIQVGEEKDLDQKADEYVKFLTEVNPDDVNKAAAGKASVETMGVDLQRKAAQQMGMLNQPIKNMSGRANEGGDVSNALIDLKMKVEDLDPGKFDFEPGWMSRTLGMLPGVGTPLKKYFTKYESAQTVISAIVRSLEQGRDQLLRDNTTMTEDQKNMRLMCQKLEQGIKLGQLMDQKLQYKLEREIPATDPKNKFISEELLFPLRQRIMDLQQQLAVNQQGVLATELVIRNNKELAQGVNRALNVTVTALQVGATVAMALANQKIVLDKLDAVNKTTSDLISGTAARLKTQGVEIQKRAAGTQISMDSLKSAFADINTALADLSTFRQAALPQMANTILELDKVTQDAEKTIKDVEKANLARPEVKIELS